MSCLLTQQMFRLLTQQMSCLQTQRMSCLQTQETSVRPRQRSRRVFSRKKVVCAREKAPQKLFFWLVASSEGVSDSGPHFPGECCKIILLYGVWEPAKYTEADESDEDNEDNEDNLSKMRHGGQLWPRVHRA